MRAHAQKVQREKARIWGRARRRTVENKKARPLGVLAQENIGFGLTILAPSAFKKPGNPSGLPGFFHATIRPKLPGQNCFAPLKQKLGLQSKEKRRRHPLWLSRRFDDAMRPNFCFRGNVFLRQRAFGRRFCMHARLRRGRAKGKRLALFSLQSVNKSVNRGDRKKPAERWFHGLFDGADDGNRTHTASLGSWSSTTKLHLHKLRTLLSIQHGAKKVKCFCAQTGVYCSCFLFCSGQL